MFRSMRTNAGGKLVLRQAPKGHCSGLLLPHVLVLRRRPCPEKRVMTRRKRPIDRILEEGELRTSHAGPALLDSDHLDGQDGEAMFRHACAEGCGAALKVVHARTRAAGCSRRCEHGAGRSSLESAEPPGFMQPLIGDLRHRARASPLR